MEELSATLRVEREPGTESCPDRAALSEQVVALGAPAQDPTPLTVEVRFWRESEEYAATIVSSGRKTGVRTLRAAGPDCASLTSAVTVALAVVMDVTPSAPPPQPSSAPRVVPSASTSPPTPVSRLQALAPARSLLTTQLVAGGGYGLLGPAWSPLVGLGAGLDSRQFRLGLEVFSLLPRKTTFASGRVSLWLAGGRVEACTWSALGLLRGHGARFDVERTSFQPWFAALLAVAGVVPVTPRWALRARLSAWIPLAQNRFRVDGVGQAFESEAAAGLLDIGPELRFW
jgi:hypothetical protein